jgi:hypothetical protein
MNDREKARNALDAFVNTIEATGGCVRDAGGGVYPVGDPDWYDLAGAYLLACQALGHEAVVVDEEDDSEDQDQ